MKRLLTVIAGLAVLGVLGFFALAWWPAIAPISPSPPGSFAPDLVAHGEALSGGVQPTTTKSPVWSVFTLSHCGERPP